MEEIPRKLTESSSSWAPYRGFSFLFDNPGDSLSSEGGLQRMDCARVWGGGALAFYDALEDFIEELQRTRALGSVRLAPLPRSSYHVTVWSGVDDGNVNRISPLCAGESREFLRGLPLSIHYPPANLRFVGDSRLGREPIDPICFELDRLDVLDDEALVARLRPRGELSQKAIGKLLQRRLELDGLAEHELGLSRGRAWAPHVSLGYFEPDRGGARAARSNLELWDHNLRQSLADASITFESVSLYVFTDMLSYYRSA